MSLTLLLTHPFPSQRLRKRQLMRINVYMLNTFVGCCGNCRLFETQDWFGWDHFGRLTAVGPCSAGSACRIH